MSVDGRFFDGAASRARRAKVIVEDGMLRVEGEGGEALVPPMPMTSVSCSSRVGNTPRFLRFPDGASFETPDNAAIDELFARQAPASGFVHRLESRLRYVVIGLVVTVAFVWGSVQWGVPALARAAAFALPAEASQHADRLVLQALDHQFFDATRLPQATQDRLHAAFAPLVAEASSQQPVRVLFRDAGKSIGANALALPAGTIVFTDQIVAAARRDAELVGILAHEIGHVRNRHAMRSSLQASFLGLIATLVVGDVSSVSSLVTAIPVMLTELGYSRAFEQEADLFALEMLARHGVDARALADILQRLDPGGEPSGGYLATHPPTPERVRAILDHAERQAD